VNEFAKTQNYPGPPSREKLSNNLCGGERGGVVRREESREMKLTEDKIIKPRGDSPPKKKNIVRREPKSQPTTGTD